MSKPSAKVLDLEMQLGMSRACTAELREEVSRLTSCLTTAGLQCLIDSGDPEAVAAHMESIARSHVQYEQRLERAIDLAIDRIEEISERDGGPAWHKAKDILGGDLYLLLTGLQKARS